MSSQLQPDLVGMSHEIDDLCTDLARVRRIARAEVPYLADALHALRAGRLEVTEEFLDRAITALARI